MKSILNVTTITELRGGDIQMLTVFNLLSSESDIKQYIICPDNAILTKILTTQNKPFFTYKKNKIKLINLAQQVIKICKEKKIDIIHIHDSSALNAGLIAMLFLPKSTNLILSRKRDNRIKDFFLNRIKYSNTKISKIICVSRAVAKIFDNIIKDENRIQIIYDAIDVKKFSESQKTFSIHTELNFTRETMIVGNIAGLTEQKDIFTFIDTAAVVLKHNNNICIKFVIFGEGEKRLEIEDQIKELQLEKDIFLMGFRKNVAELLADFDVLLMTSINEGLPLCIYEALASRIPIVTTKAGGIPEVIINEETGFTTEIKDFTKLAENVLYVLNHQKEMEIIKENGFKLVSNYHNLKYMKGNYHELYRNL
jgi:glycosyltransferase involved in cell wall biosynthesis